MQMKFDFVLNLRQNFQKLAVKPLIIDPPPFKNRVSGIVFLAHISLSAIGHVIYQNVA